MDVNNLPPGGIHLYLLPDGLNFVVTQDKVYDTTLGKVTVPAGFKTDGPSIPERFRSVINSLGKHFFAAVLHDFWYRVIWAREVMVVKDEGVRKKPTIEELEAILDQEGNSPIKILPNGEIRTVGEAEDNLIIVTKKRADDIFLKEMKDLKVPWWRRRLMYRAVRVGGASSWRE